MTFTYDKTGNRLTKTESGATTYYRYNWFNQLLCYGANPTAVNNDCAAQTGQTYDLRGNLTSSTATTGNDELRLGRPRPPDQRDG